MYELTESDRSGTQSVAEWVSAYRFDSAPQAVRREVDYVLLDTLGVMLGSTRFELGRRIIEAGAALASGGAIAVPGAKPRYDVVSAGLVTGTLAHGIELDEVHLPSRSHTGAAVCSAVLPLAQHVGASLRTAREALLVGYEVAGHLGVALDNDRTSDRSFHTSGIAGAVGCAAASARLLGLDAGHTYQALGLAASQASGTLAWHSEPHHMSKSFQIGVAARNGITAGIVAQHGYQGPIAVFGGPCNMFNAFRGEEAPAGWYQAMGKEFEILNSAKKLYAAGRPMHAALDALLMIMREESIKAAQIESIEVRMPPGSARIVDGNHTPNIDCRSVLATAALDERFGIDQAEGERMLGDDVRQMMRRVTLIHDTSLDPYFPQTWPAKVRVVTRDGRQREETVIGATGERERPVSVAQLKDKFLALAAPVIGERSAGRLTDAILGAADMPLSELVPLFAAG